MARVPYVSPDDLDPEYRDYVVSALQGKPLHVYASIANNPAVLAGLRAFLRSLWTDSGLTERQRELVILTVAAEDAADYEWHQHVNIATGVGLTREEIAAIAADDLGDFPPEEVALVEYARAAFHGEVTDDLHEAVAEAFGTEAVVGAAATVAGYLGLARVIDALGVELEDGDEFVGWELD
ncbi:MAG: carboxymuconolactone decarboxylase family protein [Salinigranum sp.]